MIGYADNPSTCRTYDFSREPAIYCHALPRRRGWLPVRKKQLLVTNILYPNRIWPNRTCRRKGDVTRWEHLIYLRPDRRAGRGWFASKRRASNQKECQERRRNI